MTIHSSYLKNVLCLEYRKKVIEKLRREIKKSGLEFDAIAFMGMSGAVIAPTLGDKLKKPVIMVRKQKDTSHAVYGGNDGDITGCTYSVEGYTKGTTYIIIDDLMASGNTLRQLDKTIRKNESFDHYHCVGVFLYQSRGCGKELRRFTFMDGSIVNIHEFLIEREEENED